LRSAVDSNEASRLSSEEKVATVPRQGGYGFAREGVATACPGESRDRVAKLALRRKSAGTLLAIQFAFLFLASLEGRK
jgi:hypothetical protein